MATVTASALASMKDAQATRHGNTAVPYLVEQEIDLSKIATQKGSALAAGDIVEAIKVPAGSVVLLAGLAAKTVKAGSSTDVALDFGITGNDPDRFVDGWVYGTAAAGDFAPFATTAITPIAFSAVSETLDILIAAQSGTVTGGIVRAWAVLLDVNDRPQGGIVGLTTRYVPSNV